MVARTTPRRPAKHEPQTRGLGVQAVLTPSCLKAPRFGAIEGARKKGGRGADEREDTADPRQRAIVEAS